MGNRNYSIACNWLLQRSVLRQNPWCCMQIIVRKVYHLLAGGLFVPVFFWDLPMLCLSLAIAFAALQLLEVVRHLQLPRLGAAVEQFMQVGAVCT